MTIKSHQIDVVITLNDGISIGSIVPVNLHGNHIISHFSFYSAASCMTSDFTLDKLEDIITCNIKSTYLKKVYKIIHTCGFRNWYTPSNSCTKRPCSLYRKNF